MAKAGNCQLDSAKLFIAGKISAIEDNEKNKLANFLQENYGIDLTLPEASASCCKQLFTVAAKYDLIKMMLAAIVCYYMPIPTNNPILSKIFNASIASASSYGIGLLSKCRSCQFFSAKNKEASNTSIQSYNSTENYIFSVA